MKIIQLTADNVKRLKAVEITPDGTVQIITGRNSQGKTSVLDAIWLALGGGAASRETARPVRDGEDTARVTLDLGDLIVTRTWTGTKTALTVMSANGAKFSSPQTVLDNLVGRLSFDPLEFTRRPAREQLAALLDIVDLDLDLNALAQNRATLYATRTEAGRTLDQLRGELAGLGEVEEAPEREQSAAELANRIREGEHLHRLQVNLAEQVAELRAEISRREQELVSAREDLAEQIGKLDQLVDLDVPDVDAMLAELGGIEEKNRAVRRNQHRAQVAASVATVEQTRTDLTTAIDQLDQQKAAALAAAEFPVEGLGFDDGGVTYNGVPFSQASSSEQIRVSLAMAMALNPKLRVIRILDGSLLDADNLQMITNMAETNDYQVWVERVGDQSGVGVVIEDGQAAQQ